MTNVLIIDDEKDVVDVLQRALHRFGYDVKTASSGVEGVTLFENSDFNLVITDIIMPYTDGHAVAAHIRNSSKSNVPIIGISGTPWLLNDEVFDVVLSKPFSLHKLADALNSVLYSEPERVAVHC